MKISTQDNYLLIENDKEALAGFSSDLTKAHSEFQDKNVVIDLTSYKNSKAEDLLAFLEISNIHRSHNRSFVIVNDALGIDDLPEELVVVPTLQEAEDMIQMDEIQRDLGF